MRTRLIRALTDLPIRDPIARRQAPLLLLLLVALIALSVTRLLFFLGIDRASIGTLPAVMIVLAQLLGPTIALMLLLRGHFSAAALLTALEILLTIVIATVATGLRQSGMLPLVFALPIVFAGLLVDWRGLALVGATSCAVVIGIATLEAQHSPLVAFAPSPEQPASMASIFVFVAALLLLLLSRFRQDYRRELDEHLRAEATLRQSEARFATVFRASPAALMLMHLDSGQILDVNESYCRLLGYRRDEMLGRTAIELNMYPRQSDRAALLETMRTKGSIHEIEVTLRTISGALREVLWSIDVLETQGEPCMLTTAVDITERKAATQALQRSEERLRVLADASRAFAEAGAEYQPVLEYVAKTTASILGDGCHIRLLSDDQATLELVALYSVEPLSPALSQVLQAQPARVDDPGIVASVFRSGQPACIPVVTREQLRDTSPPAFDPLLGRFAPHSMIVAPLRLQAQRIGVLVLTRYESERPSFTDDDLTLAQDLANRAALAIGSARLFQDLQAELAERKQVEVALAKQAEDLTRSNAELEQFAYVASHDLQEPLRAVAGMVQLLQQRYQGQIDARADQYIAYAVEGATRMQALISDLLVFSRVGTRTRPFAPIEADDVLRTALANLAVAIDESGAIITATDLPTVWGDASQLTQLFQNLIGNAIKFHSDQPPAIRISAERLGNEWRIAVSDNGIGIEQEYFERIFVVFQRLHTRRAYAGTGIGLALCKKIVERHGGRIWVESTPGKGSTFAFTMPDRSDPNAN